MLIDHTRNFLLTLNTRLGIDYEQYFLFVCHRFAIVSKIFAKVTTFMEKKKSSNVKKINRKQFKQAKILILNNNYIN
jgi:hypothetical protein